MDRINSYSDNIVCILVILVLFLSVSFQKAKKDKTASRFNLLAHMVLGFLITDFIADIVYGRPEYNKLAYVVNVLLFLWTDIIIIAFSTYLQTLMGHASKKWSKIMNPGVMIIYINILIELVLAFTGNLFTIDENGYYQEQNLAMISYIMTFLALVLIMIVVINKKSYFTRHQLIVMIVYLVLPILAGIGEMITGFYELTVIAITISVLLIYTMIQSGIIEGYKIKESVLEDLSYTDFLTDLKNRRAYYDRISNLKKEHNLAVFFCDINRLKYTNDNFGHSEGDKLIITFSELLLSIFEAKDVYRISGDEFVVLTEGISKSDYFKLVEQFKRALIKNNSIASFGSSFGVASFAQELLSFAEKEMYANKKAYYDNNDTQR